MKFWFDMEDVVLGIIVGVLLISFSGKYNINIPFAETILLIVAPITAVFAFLDIIHHMQGITNHFGGWLFLTVHNLLNIAVLASLFGHLINYTIPYLSIFSQNFINDNNFLFFLGIYFIVGYIFHIIVDHVVVG